MKREQTIAEPDVVLIGGGIMSATLGVMLQQLDPDLKIQIGEWAPLLLDGREDSETLAATRAAFGTDVNFGALTVALVRHLDMFEVIERCFSKSLESWCPKLEALIPRYGKNLVEDKDTFRTLHERAANILGLSD